MSYFAPLLFRHGTLLSGADLDQYFSNLLAVCNGSLDASNFASDAGLQLANRQTHGNRGGASGGFILTLTAADGTTAASVVLLDIGAAADHLGVPGVLRILELGMSVQTYTRPMEANDHLQLMWRGFNTRTNAWTTWTATTVDKPAAGTSARDLTVTNVISDQDYSKLQLRVELTNVAGGDVTALGVRGVEVWAIFESLHLP